jgi:DNA adenine methylase
MRFYSPLRYPGGKAFLASELEGIIKTIGLDKPTYVEPYAGGAGAALFLLMNDKVQRIVINDLDKAIYAFWKSATEKSEQFAKKILTTPITIAEWKRQKQIYLNENADMFERGFATFFLNRTNRSGVMNAGPIGGKRQEGSYKINAKYNKKDLAERIRKIGEYKEKIEVLNEDGIKLAKRYLSQKNVFIYLDPPYFKKGAMLYLNHYDEDDHKKLADLLNAHADEHWVLTYDETAKIRSLYPKRARKRLYLNYRVHDSSMTRQARELMIFSDLIRVR